MLFFLQLSVFILLSIIAFQDFKDRLVWLWVYIAFLLLELTISFLLGEWNVYNVFFNLSFLLLQYLGVALYFSIKARKIKFVFYDEIGLGDILFFLTIAICLSPTKFLFIYFNGLIAAIAWYLFQSFIRKNETSIPLAGVFAFVLMNIKIIEYLDYQKYTTLQFVLTP